MVCASQDHLIGVYGFSVVPSALQNKNEFAVCRSAASRRSRPGDEAIRAYPDMRSSVRANRAFLQRAVRYVTAEAGIRQFLDIGTGLPSANNTHEVAQAITPEARVLYVDNDPIVLAHARSLLTSGPHGVTGYLDADARDTGTILTEAARVLDFSQPITVMLVAVLQFVTDKEAASELVARLMRAVAPGSFLVISHPPSDMQRQAPGVAEAAVALSKLMAHPLTARSREQVTSFFDGLDLIEPGVVPIQQWRPDNPADAAARAGMWSGVARKL
jgi:trans-aconitate methyltransferase